MKKGRILCAPCLDYATGYDSLRVGKAVTVFANVGVMVGAGVSVAVADGPAVGVICVATGLGVICSS